MWAPLPPLERCWRRARPVPARSWFDSDEGLERYARPRRPYTHQVVTSGPFWMDFSRLPHSGASVTLWGTRVASGRTVTPEGAGSTPAPTADASVASGSGRPPSKRLLGVRLLTLAPPLLQRIWRRASEASWRRFDSARRDRRRVRLVAGPRVLSAMTGVRFPDASPAGHGPSSGAGADATNVGDVGSTPSGATGFAWLGRQGAAASHTGGAGGAAPPRATTSACSAARSAPGRGPGGRGGRSRQADQRERSSTRRAPARHAGGSRGRACRSHVARA